MEAPDRVDECQLLFRVFLVQTRQSARPRLRVHPALRQYICEHRRAAEEADGPADVGGEAGEAAVEVVGRPDIGEELGSPVPALAVPSTGRVADDAGERGAVVDTESSRHHLELQERRRRELQPWSLGGGLELVLDLEAIDQVALLADATAAEMAVGDAGGELDRLLHIVDR